MNNKEVIEIIKDLSDRGYPTYKDAKQLAIKALEKQIPQPPDFWGDGYSDGELVYDMWDCPGCGESYEVECDKYDYCPKCGQAIDWNRTVDKDELYKEWVKLGFTDEEAEKLTELTNIFL